MSNIAERSDFTEKKYCLTENLALKLYHVDIILDKRLKAVILYSWIDLMFLYNFFLNSSSSFCFSVTFLGHFKT